VRDKVLRYYHLIRPLDPRRRIPHIDIGWGESMHEVKTPKMTGKLWYQLLSIGLVQWSFARCKEHLPELLKACAALDGRTQCNTSDFRLLIKLLKPMRLERYLITQYGFESGFSFLNNVFCLLIELASHGTPTIETICVDYKCSPATVIRIAKTAPDWVWIKSEGERRLMPTDHAKEVLQYAGAYDKW